MMLLLPPSGAIVDLGRQPGPLVGNSVLRVGECCFASEVTRCHDPAPLEPAHQGADVLGMEDWDGWQAEIQERLAELTDDRPSPEPVRERRWVRLVRLWFGLRKA